VIFVEGRLWDSGGDDDTHFIAKSPSRTINWNTQYSKGIMEIIDLFTALSCYHEFSSTGCSYNCMLIIAKSGYQCLIYQMKNTRHCTASAQIKMENGVCDVWTALLLGGGMSGGRSSWTLPVQTDKAKVHTEEDY
jgi:hypothetical protein